MAARWWQHAVFFQIYPRSFADSNRDGIGDLDGITSRLDYLSELGIDAIWLNPINPSPNRDWGYDVSDYCNVHPDLGDLASFDRLLDAAHQRAIRVIIDFVPGHTSDQHPWFAESRSSRSNPQRDWYIWAPGKAGGPPNNWQSVFRGSAWEYDAASNEYYLHSYLRQQPDLNYRNPRVLNAMLGVLRFWLERGVDGFRVDVIFNLLKDALLRDNPLDAKGSQIAIYSTEQPEVHDLIRSFRATLDRFSDRVMVGEVWPRDSGSLADYLRPDELQLAFNFRFFSNPWEAAAFRASIEETESSLGSASWPTYTLSNHDFPRHITRYAGDGRDNARARMAAVMLMTLRGTPFIYYGEEIGMRDLHVPRDLRRDPVGRDGCRTPMQWSGEPNGGFTAAARPWLPLGDFASINVKREEADPRSMLNLYRGLTTMRRAAPALLDGSLHLRSNAPADCLVFTREHPEQRLLIALNFAAEPRDIECGDGQLVLSSIPYRTARAIRGPLQLHPDEGAIIQLNA